MDAPTLFLALPFALPAIVLLASFLAMLRPAARSADRPGLSAEHLQQRAHEQQERQRHRYGQQQIQPPVPIASLHRVSRPSLRPPAAAANHESGTNAPRRGRRAVA
jgi:hypothetical protein